MVTHDRGADQGAAKGLPPGARAIADKADPRLFYGSTSSGAASWCTLCGRERGRHGKGRDWCLGGDVKGAGAADFMIQTNIQIVQTDVLFA